LTVIPECASFPQFEKYLSQVLPRLVLPNDAVVRTPPKPRNVDDFEWDFKWIVTFGDRKYMRVWESYVEHPDGGQAYRERFVYHYGAIVAELPGGIPYGEFDDPVDLRIDNDGGRAHMHYQAPNPHHYAASVGNLDMEKIRMHRFVEAVLRHRAKGRPFKELLKFTLPEADESNG